MSGRRSNFGAYTRALDGLICTLVDLDSGAIETRHLRGLNLGRRRGGIGPSTLLRELCAELDARPGRWRIRTLSSPTTILTDLRKRDTPLRPIDDRKEGYGNIVPPEQLMLSMIGRRDLWDPPAPGIGEPRGRVA